MYIIRLVITAILLCVFAPQVLSETVLNETSVSLVAAIEKASNLKLESAPRWHKLLHYKKKTLRSSYSSVVDDDQFFISPKGKHSPKDELNRTLELLFSVPFNGSSEVLNQHAICRFPARVKFLIETLDLPDHMDTTDQCLEYSNWRKDKDIQDVWLIFPSAYINSPSSMFGHTLLRLDPKESSADSQLLSHAVNYAAKVDTADNGLFYAAKGLFGGYNGYFSMMPYYEKVKEYNRLENRDIWEYKLNTQPEEIEWLLRHMWELHKVRFDYFFITQNCSYQLLALLEVARPEVNLTDRFRYIAIPVDTVREVYRQGWIDDEHFRPSKSTEFYNSVAALTPTERKLVAKLKAKDYAELQGEVESLPFEQQQRVLQTGYKLLRLDKKSRANTGRSLKLLSERSKLGKTEAEKTKSTAVAPQDGHLSHRISFGAASSKADAYPDDDRSKSSAILDFKFTYHGLDDPIPGFSRDAQINFLHGIFFTEDDDVKLESFDVLNIRSLTPSDQFISRRAWQVSTGWRREIFEEGQRVLVPQVNAEFGRVYKLDQLRLYALAGAQLEAKSVEGARVQVGPRADLGVLFQGQHLATEVRGRYAHMIDSGLTRASVEWNTTFFASKRISLAMKLRHERNNYDQEWNQVGVQINYFY